MSALQFLEPSYVSVNAHKLAYEDVSPPNPAGTVVLITGLASKRQGWHYQVPVFAQRYRTIVFDNRDIGDSDFAIAPYRTADQADDAAGLLYALGVSRAHIVGISMGGFIALELALRHPELVDKLVLTSTSAGERTHVQPHWTIRMMLMMPRIGKQDPGKIAKQVYARIMAPGYCKAHPDDWEDVARLARYRPQPQVAYRRQLQACLRHDVTGRLGEITAPTLVVHGTVDPLVRAANGKYLADHIPNARLILYPNTGHIPTVERAEDYNRDVLAFLSE